MFLCRQHENREHQLRRQQHLNDDALRNGCPSTQSRAHVQIPREQHIHQRSSDNSTQNLRHKEQQAPHPANRPNHHHSHRHGRVEQPPANPEEHPCICCKTESETQGNVQELSRVLLCYSRYDCVPSVCVGAGVRDLSSCEREEEEGDCAD